MATTPEKDEEKPKHRPIIRIGIFIIAHSLSVSVVCCTAGVLALLLFPVIAKKTYVSENALLPDSANPMISDKDVSRANIFVNELTSLKLKSQNTAIEIPRLIALHMANLRGEVSYHKFQTQSNKFHPLRFFTSPNAEADNLNTTCESYATNTIGIVRAQHGDGKEAIVLVTPYNSVNLTQNEALSLGIAYSAFSLLAQVNWLAKDIIWIAADSRYGEYNAVAAWLREYHTPSSNGLHESIETEVYDTFRRAGTMAAALVIKVANRGEEGEKDALNIYAEASNGQMPNLDLINIVSYMAVHGEGLSVHVEKLVSLLDSRCLKFIGHVFERVGNVVRRLNPQWKFGIPVKDYVEGGATLVSSLYHQALGVPTGSHGAFRDYQIDAITIEITTNRSSTNKGGQDELLLQGGRLIETVLRSINNLLEKFHQSFFLYLLTSSNKFISVGVYMIAFLLLVAPLPVLAAALFSDAGKSIHKSEKNSKPFKSWRWLHPAKTICLIHLWGAIISLLPYFIYQIPNSQPTYRLLIWAFLSLFILTVLGSLLGARSTQWAVLKSVTVSTAFIGLCLMSVINFATAEIGALLLVPLCLMIKPWRLAGKAHSALNLVLVALGFPGVVFLVVKSAFGFQNGSSLVEFWYWMESLWAWNSATYIYIGMVHLPCWVLCIYILLHPC
ncbi:putative GPI transamidase component Gaa1 [Helianthus annuus]|nr:putative GPI transamidase component Gaa1 [Helianthus annuus]KAJ0447273.1 putative GPI transamidase component Gaa1 [Helianthus annuus]KAJ0636052.1 putative GPI transamidase component Gaa1 [Helianthus annuus]KAJ0826020.1 putative GPI transamidase component Gaa1 [Helianthus annuus]